MPKIDDPIGQIKAGADEPPKNPGTELAARMASWIPVVGNRMKHVCESCIANYPLQELINREAVETKCDYCGAVSDGEPIAAPISELMPRIWEGLQTEWADPGDEG